MSTDKKTIIYEAVLSLINEKHEMTNIKVSDIAKTANIGKGTIYEYFESKEQIIAEAFVYTAEKVLFTLKEIMEKGLGFKESYISILESIGNLFSQNNILIKYITLNEKNFCIKQKVQGMIHKEFAKIRKGFMDVYEELVDLSVKEGIIKEKPPTFDWYMAILNSIMSLIVIQKHRFEEFKDQNTEEIFEKLYDMYVKLLS